MQHTDTKLSVPALAWAYFCAKLAELSKRSRKLGLVAMVATELSREIRPTQFLIRDPQTGEGCWVDRDIQWINFRLTGDTPRLAGWSLVAVIEHTDGGNIVRRVPWVDADLPADLQSCEPTCDHCNVRRDRRDTFFLAHESGKVARVGRTCLQDFLGGVSPERIVSLATQLATIQTMTAGFDSGDFSGCGGGRYGVDLLDYLAHVSAEIRFNGWVPRSKSDGHNATADFAWNTATNPQAKGARPEARDYERASEALANVEAECETAAAAGRFNDYLSNVRTVSRMSAIQSKHAGLAASIVPMLQRSKERAARDAERAARENTRKELSATLRHLGAVRERITFDGTVERVRSYVSQFGPGYVIAFRDGEGNHVTWFGSGRGADKVADMEPGTPVTVTGTVKAHDSYKGTPQTVVNRCKVTAR